MTSTKESDRVAKDSREARYVSALEGVRSVVRGMIVFYIFSIAVELPRFSVPTVRAVVLHDFGVLVTFMLIALLLRRKLIAPRYTDVVSCFLATLVPFSVYATVLFQQSPAYLIFVSFILVGLGLFLLSWKLLVTWITMITMATVIVASRVTTADEFKVECFTLLVAVILSAAIFATRSRSHRRIDKLRQADSESRQALRVALDAAERELIDRQRAEEARLELEDQLAHSQRLESIGSLAGGVAHDINNVLGGISAFASLVREAPELEESTAADVDEILASCRRGQALTQNLLAFARKSEHRTERFNPNETVREVERLLSRTIPKIIELDTHLEEEIDDVFGDPGQLCQAVMNLCINAVDAMPDGGRLVLVTEGVLIETQRHIAIRVRDTGTGMDAETKQRVFEPFFTTKETGKGSGLGLSMVYGTIAQFGGSVDVDTELGKGTTISFVLPAVDESDPRQSRDSVPIQSNQSMDETILVVDDELPIRKASKRILESRGYRVLLAENGVNALDIYAEHRSEIGLVILDMAMPVLDGPGCFRALRELDPGIPVMVMTGFSSGGGVEELLEAGALLRLSKPFDMQQLLAAVAQSLSLRDTRGADNARPAIQPATTNNSPSQY